MNENLNLVDILKDCPKGTKLYSTMYGDVKFESINEDKSHPIIVRIDDDHTECFSIDGKIYSFYYGECTLFPSREQRDWGKFELECLKAADAEPNLASRWHDASEEPMDNSEILVQWNIKGSSGYESYYTSTIENWEKFLEKYGVSRWAYIDDLLPKQFGNSEQLKGGEK